MGNERAWDTPEAMLSVDDALARILDRFSPLPAVETAILDALGMVLSADVVSTVDVPPFRNSAMDGYAIRAEDTASAPVALSVVGEVAAGNVADRPVGRGEAIRIMTGAPVPDGADSVVRFEETDESARSGRSETPAIGISRQIAVGENVRLAGEDLRSGQIALQAGLRVGPAEIGVLASLNLAAVAVHRRPRVAILSTGDELVEPGSDLRPGQIRDSNGVMLAAYVRQAGGEPILAGIAGDSTEDLRSKLRAFSAPDLFITSGGVSVGDYDVVKDVLRAEGEIDIWQVRMKPGKPLAFGTIADVPLLGLPGNPVAALVSFLQFGRPAIRKMLGHRNLCLPEVDATLAAELRNRGRRRHFVRGVVATTPSGFEAHPVAATGSAILSAASRANCFIVVPEMCDVVEAGETVRVQLIDDVGLV
ncbi:MAG TPA: gephyrin-like molybdotransferase Glp [Thermomicrobiales bacterium]|nr:gephyrin-like molybdotransferase Glp [Thermomicrobiales bacterium]